MVYELSVQHDNKMMLNLVLADMVLYVRAYSDWLGIGTCFMQIYSHMKFILHLKCFYMAIVRKEIH